MADMVLSPLVGAVIETLVSTLIEKGRMILQLNDDLDNLSNTLGEIRLLLKDAEARQITEGLVKNWLGELKDVAYDADDLLDEIVYEALRREAEGESNKGKRKEVRNFFPSCSCFGLKQGPSKLDIATRVKGINERIEKIHKARDKFSFTEGDGRTTRGNENAEDQLRVTTSFFVGTMFRQALQIKCFTLFGICKDHNVFQKLDREELLLELAFRSWLELLKAK